MIHAHFTIRLGEAALPASAAQWVADADAARAAARVIVQGLMRQHGGDPRLFAATMVITDAAGATILEIPFFDALYMPVEPVAEPDRRTRRIPPPSRLGAALRPFRRLADALGARMQPLHESSTGSRLSI
ncbi:MULTISPECIES: DUF6894 family protein [unclassified Methylobacterium]|jgi:hypothetical protein|uniref:DUF6894 family protein n=1 Tax=unclassified Methylobacterium TaxID=2615210 RepID=UPI001352D753|nr:catalase [Methylobacterium sp. 2A]MWV25638.1 catalase [Methylobacterium sp. 2A]